MGIYGISPIMGNEGFASSTLGLCLCMLKGWAFEPEVGVLCLRARGVVPLSSKP